MPESLLADELHIRILLALARGPLVILEHRLEILTVYASMLINRVQPLVTLEVDEQNPAQRPQIGIHYVVSSRKE